MSTTSLPARRAGALLRPRERQVLELIAEGRGNKEIARDLYISPQTVKSHVGRLRERLGARTRAHAVAIGFRTGELSSSHPEPM